MFQQAARPLLIDAFPQEEQLISRVLRFMGLVNHSGDRDSIVDCAPNESNHCALC